MRATCSFLLQRRGGSVSQFLALPSHFAALNLQRYSTIAWGIIKYCNRRVFPFDLVLAQALGNYRARAEICVLSLAAEIFVLPALLEIFTANKGHVCVYKFKYVTDCVEYNIICWIVMIEHFRVE